MTEINSSPLVQAKARSVRRKERQKERLPSLDTMRVRREMTSPRGTPFNVGPPVGRRKMEEQANSATTLAKKLFAIDRDILAQYVDGPVRDATRQEIEASALVITWLWC